MTPDEQHQLMVSVGRFQTPPYDKEPLFACVDSLLAQARAEALEEAAKICEQLYDSSGEAHTEYDCAATIRARKDGQ